MVTIPRQGAFIPEGLKRSSTAWTDSHIQLGSQERWQEPIHPIMVNFPRVWGYSATGKAVL